MLFALQCKPSLFKLVLFRLKSIRVNPCEITNETYRKQDSKNRNSNEHPCKYSFSETK